MKRKATKEERFWRFLERNHKVVSRWPSWMKGGNAVTEALAKAREGTLGERP